jgi:Lytic transglycolase
MRAHRDHRRGRGGRTEEEPIDAAPLPPTSERQPARRGRLTVRKAVPLAILATISTLLVATGSIARPPSPIAFQDPGAFTAVVMAAGTGEPTLPPPSIDDRATADADPIGDFQEAEARSFAPRAIPDQSVDAESVLKPTPRPTPPPKPTHSVSGRAAWYCNNGSGCPAGYSGGLYAAAGPELRVGNWRGRTVTVCGSGNCVSVTLVDWCACGGARVIDLFGDAYSRLAPLGTGTVAVRVSW